LGDVHIPATKLKAYERVHDIGTVDWINVALKSSALEAIPVLIEPLATPNTRVVTIMNGLIEDNLIRFLKHHMKDHSPAGSIGCCAALYGAMAFTRCERVAPGYVRHTHFGGLTAALAVANPNANHHRDALEQLWLPTPVQLTYEASLLRGRWLKNIYNLAFNGISVSMGGITVDQIVNDPGLRRLATIIMDETVAIANADLAMHGEDPSTFFGDKEKAFMMGLSDVMGAASTSTMADFLERRPMEVKYLFRTALDRANQLKVPAPHLETLVIQVEAYQRFYNLF
jgi:2-dehydropantoate 2-reductase